MIDLHEKKALWKWKTFGAMNSYGGHAIVSFAELHICDDGYLRVS